MRTFKVILAILAVIFISGTGYIFYSSTQIEADIENHRRRIKTIGNASPSIVFDPMAITTLPVPVQRYFKFVFLEPQPALSFVSMTMEGDFRRPKTEGFEATTAEQVIAIAVPALAFSATTPIIPGIKARAYDAYANGEMEMKAIIMSVLTVVHEKETPELNRISLRRWLLESPLYPAALLPGGPVRWEAIDEMHARAIVSADGLEASFITTFRPDGSLERFDAEQDGDLNTPYHGSGEHVLRSDYRLVSGLMIPHSFTIARAAGEKIYPFWKGRITSINYEIARY